MSHDYQGLMRLRLLFRRLQAEAKASQVNGRFQADEVAVFGTLDVFVNRCRRLADLFTTIHQFSTLGQVCSYDWQDWALSGSCAAD